MLWWWHFVVQAPMRKGNEEPHVRHQSDWIVVAKGNLECGIQSDLFMLRSTAVVIHSSADRDQDYVK